MIKECLDSRVFLMRGIALSPSERNQFEVNSIGDACVLKEWKKLGFKKPSAFRILRLEIDIDQNCVWSGILKETTLAYRILMSYSGGFFETKNRLLKVEVMFPKVNERVNDALKVSGSMTSS